MQTEDWTSYCTCPNVHQVWILFHHIYVNLPKQHLLLVQLNQTLKPLQERLLEKECREFTMFWWWWHCTRYQCHIPLHCHGAKVHLQPKQECFYLQGQAEEGQVMVVAGVLLSSLFGASTYCRKANFAQAGHKMRMGKSAIKQETPW
jgi:hypothetical protein